ncbi:hypothetical protein BJV74DRAFT_856693 [Russula compacta]|nr:hypothetical protein BJV74DRAFT_856693 [Russula compacta]
MVSIPLNKDLEDELEHWVPNGKMSLNAREKLFKALPVSTDQEWLIVIIAPTFDSRAANPSVAAPDLTI